MTETLTTIKENDIRTLASSQSFERGAAYYRSGALFNTRCVGDELRGHCHGSGYTPYRVSVRWGPHGIEAAYCSCPYDWGGICKHLVALLLAGVHTPEVFQAVAPTAERLAEKRRGGGRCVENGLCTRSHISTFLSRCRRRPRMWPMSSRG